MESREGPRINGILGVSANNGTNSEVDLNADLSRTSDGNAANREFEKTKYQSNQRRFRITKLHDGKKPGTQEATAVGEVVQTDSILNLS